MSADHQQNVWWLTFVQCKSQRLPRCFVSWIAMVSPIVFRTASHRGLHVMKLWSAPTIRVLTIRHLHKNIYSLNQAQLNQWMVDNDVPVYRSAQLWSWLYKNRTKSFDEMSNVPQNLREKLSLEVCSWQNMMSRLQLPCVNLFICTFTTAVHWRFSTPFGRTNQCGRDS